MKQIPLLQGKALLIELPESAETPNLIFMDGFWHLTFFTYDGEILTRKRLPKGRWRIIGMLSEVTEDDLTDVINVLVSSESDKNLYPNLTGGPWKVSRIESLESAIEVEGYYLDENPMGSISPNSMDYKTIFSNPEARAKAVDAWNEAQSRVLYRSRCLLLGRESKPL